MKNRLNLDFNITTVEARNNFIKSYLNDPMFIQCPPTEKELQIMSDYILWGVDKSGKNGRQAGLDIKSRRSTWDPDKPVESLEALIESPTFNEASLSASPICYTKKRNVFSREDALRSTSGETKEAFKSLFAEIDRIELMINLYEIACGKRTAKPREQLVNAFTPAELASISKAALAMDKLGYIKSRHLLVELRNQQYALQDSYKTTTAAGQNNVDVEPDFVFDFGVGIHVLPLGLKTNSVAFRDFEGLEPRRFSEDDLKVASKLYWEFEELHPTNNYFDFTNQEHVYQFCLGYKDLASQEFKIDSMTPALIETFEYYVRNAKLDEIQRLVLERKLDRVRNVDIACEVNKRFGTRYMPNYISTIFRQRIVVAIANAANEHKTIVGMLWCPEEFKICSQCGRQLLKVENNFIRKNRSQDGFTCRCKRCDRDNRAKGGKV